MDLLNEFQMVPTFSEYYQTLDVLVKHNGFFQRIITIDSSHNKILVYNDLEDEKKLKEFIVLKIYQILSFHNQKKNKKQKIFLF